MKSYKHLAAVGAVCGGLLLPSFVQAAPTWESRYKDAPDAAQWQWTQAPWDASDKPFIAIRKRIDEAVAKGQKPEVLARRFKELARMSAPGAPKFKIFKRDAKAQFAFGYSSYLAWQAIRLQNNRRGRLALVDVPFALEQPPFPRSYQYARLMFIVASISFQDQRLRWAGERLLKRNPNDYEVNKGLINVLIDTTLLKEPERTQINRLFSKLLRRNPKDRLTWSAVGFFYYLRSRQTNRVEDVEKASNGYKRYLSLAPKTDEFRKTAKSYIAELEKRKKELAS